MSELFNPYHKWLGIPPNEQPANHYRLLGIALFESDPEVIESAADRQMAHVRTFQTGRYSEQSQEVLNILSAAKVCLLKLARKTEYDEQLRAKLEADKPKPLPQVPQPIPAIPTSPSTLLRNQILIDAPTSRRSIFVPFVAILMLVLLSLAGWLVWLQLNRQNEPAQAARDDVEKSPATSKPAEGKFSKPAVPRDAEPPVEAKRSAEPAKVKPPVIVQPVLGPDNQPKQAVVPAPADGLPDLRVARWIVSVHDQATIRTPDGRYEQIQYVVPKPPFEIVSIELRSERSVPEADFAMLGELKGLLSVILGGKQMTDGRLSYLQSVKSLRTLKLVDSPVSDAGLVHLQGLTELRSLALPRTRVTDAGLLNLRHLEHLEKLDLYGLRITDAGLSQLATFPWFARLRELNLSETEITSAGLVHLRSLTQLENLCLDRTKIDDAGMQYVAGHARLDFLYLRDLPITDKGLEQLTSLNQLQSICINNTKVTDAGVEKLKAELPATCRISH